MKENDSRIKILQVVGGMNAGGVETLLMSVFRAIDRDKYQFIFLCYGNKDKAYLFEPEIKKMGGSIIRTQSPRQAGGRSYIKTVKQIMIENQIDVVHLHTLFASMFGLIAAFLAGVKVRIVHSHSIDSDIKKESLSKRIYHLVARIVFWTLSTRLVACSKAAANYLFYKSVPIIYNGIKFDDFSFDSNLRKAKRQELGLDEKTVLVGHVGRFNDVKNHPYLIEVFAEYRKINPSTKLILFGDGDQEAIIRQKIDELEVTKEVIFMGSRADLNQYYSAMDVMLLPSFFEGLGIALIEAQVNQLPAIASKRVPLEAKISNGLEFLSIDDNPKVWAEKIEIFNRQLFVPEKVDSDNKYNIQNTAKQFEELYDKK